MATVVALAVMTALTMSVPPARAGGTGLDLPNGKY